MAGDDDVVVADGRGEEVADLRGVGKLNDLLRAAEIRFGLAPEQLPLGDKMAGEVARDLADGDRTGLAVATNGHADARLEVGVEFITTDHVERDGAVGEHHLARLGVDGRGIGLKACAAGQGLHDAHGEHRGYIALATGDDAIGVEPRES